MSVLAKDFWILKKKKDITLDIENITPYIL